MSFYQFNNPTKVISGVDAIKNELAKCAKKLGMKNILLITGPIISKLGLANYAQDVLLKADINIAQIYTTIPNDSSTETVDEIVNVFVKNNCDGILAIGGGSVIDTAKAARLVLSQKQSSLKELFGYNMTKIGTKLPFIAIPTTCGTGSEVTKVAVISNEEINAKEEIISDILLPDFAILDPKMLETLPKKSILLTAFDALAHAIEGYCGKGKNPLSDTYALLAIKNIFEFLQGALESDNCLENYLHLLEGANFAGISFSNSMVGGTHAIAHSLGSALGVGHDFAVASVLPYVLKFNLDASKNEYARLYTFLTCDNLLSNDEKAEKFVDLIFEFLSDNAFKIGGIPTLKECGLEKDKFDLIAKITLTDGAILTNPKYMGYNDIVEILTLILGE